MNRTRLTTENRKRINTTDSRRVVSTTKPPLTALERERYSIFSKALVSKVIMIPMASIGSKIVDTLKQILENDYASKCSIEEGYVEPNSIYIKSFSSGQIMGNMIRFHVVFECKVCHPVEGMNVSCTVTIVSKAGIQGHSKVLDVNGNSPFIVNILRDHHYNIDYFSTLKVGDSFTATIINSRFEINDLQISIIAELRVPYQFESKKLVISNVETPLAPTNQLVKKDITVVIARSSKNESIDWCETIQIANKIVVYNKGNHISATSSRMTVVQLQDVGGDCHSYLQHIVDNYDNLAKVTVFLPGTSQNVASSEIYKNTLKYVNGTSTSVFICTHYSSPILDEFANFEINNVAIDENNNEKTDQSLIGRPFSVWYNHFFPGVVINDIVHGNIFGVDKSHIKSHNATYYAELMNSLTHSQNPEDAVFMEYSWLAVFNPIPAQCIYKFNQAAQPKTNKPNLAKKTVTIAPIAEPTPTAAVVEPAIEPTIAAVVEPAIEPTIASVVEPAPTIEPTVDVFAASGYGPESDEMVVESVVQSPKPDETMLASGYGLGSDEMVPENIEL